MKSTIACRLVVTTMLALSAVSAISGPLFPFNSNNRWGYMDKSGKQVIGPQFERAQNFSGDLAPVRLGRWGYANTAGKIIINPQFDEATPFREGLALVE